MATPLKLTLGEIAFAVAIVDNADRAVQLVARQLDIEQADAALLLVRLSGHSLLARDLAISLTPTVELTPAVATIGKVFAASRWMLRCSKICGDEISNLLLHASSAGVLAHEVIAEQVHQVAPVADLAALLARVTAFFALRDTDEQLPALALPKPALDAALALHEPRAIEDLLVTHGRPAARARVLHSLAGDIAAPLWRGAVSWAHYPVGVEPMSGAAAHIVSGERDWLLELTSQDTVVVREATRQHLANAFVRALEQIPSAERKIA